VPDGSETSVVELHNPTSPSPDLYHPFVLLDERTSRWRVALDLFETRHNRWAGLKPSWFSPE
jgi:hypothetical protein